MAGTLLTTGTPSGTALRVAAVRAAHRLLDDPVVFDDPLALSILGPEAEAAMRADPYRFNDPISRGLRASLIVRSRVAEDELARAVAAGVRQYVVLGAGLDTFAYRNPFEDLRVFEIDHPATQAWKRECLDKAGIAIPDSLTFAPVDFEEGVTLAEGLAAAGFDRAEALLPEELSRRYLFQRKDGLSTRARVMCAWRSSNEKPGEGEFSGL